MNVTIIFDPTKADELAAVKALFAGTPAPTPDQVAAAKAAADAAAKAAADLAST
jgi:hypothetical protein